MDKSYLGSGKVYLRVVGTATPLAHIGNVSGLSFKHEPEVKEQKNYQSPGGGTVNSVERIKGVAVEFIMHELSPDNLAMAVYGDITAIAAGTVVDEVVTAYKGGIVRLAHANPTSVVVTNSAGTTTYVSGTDYEPRPAGPFILNTGSITNAESLKVSYSHGAQDVIDAITQPGKEYEMVFEGINEAQSGKPFIVDCWRLKVGMAQDISLIGEDFMTLKVIGKALADTSKPTGISQYYRATAVQ